MENLFQFTLLSFVSLYKYVRKRWPWEHCGLTVSKVVVGRNLFILLRPFSSVRASTILWTFSFLGWINKSVRCLQQRVPLCRVQRCGCLWKNVWLDTLTKGLLMQKVWGKYVTDRQIYCYWRYLVCHPQAVTLYQIGLHNIKVCSNSNPGLF